MERSDFFIGLEFRCGERIYRCTDVGSRVVVAIRISEVEASTSDGGSITTRVLSRAEAQREGWFNGSPYGVAEHVFDEDDMEGCEPIESSGATFMEENGEGPGTRLWKGQPE